MFLFSRTKNIVYATINTMNYTDVLILHLHETVHPHGATQPRTSQFYPKFHRSIFLRNMSDSDSNTGSKCFFMSEVMRKKYKYNISDCESNITNPTNHCWFSLQSMLNVQIVHWMNSWNRPLLLWLMRIYKHPYDNLSAHFVYRRFRATSNHYASF